MVQDKIKRPPKQKVTPEQLALATLQLLEVGSWLIWSNEHDAWWKPASAGYTRNVAEAGRYSFDNAREICDGACRGDEWSLNKGNDTPDEVMVPSPEMLAKRDQLFRKTKGN